MNRHRLMLFVFLCAAAALAWQATVRARTAPPTLAAMLPQNALLTIESPDFAALLRDWTGSPEAKSWLASNNYNVFSNSRLFGRLADAQDEFFATAFPAGAGSSAPEASALLTQLAGRQSIFAWYNIGTLEFLYITRMPSAQSLQTALLRQRGRFAQRQSAGIDFYVRTSKDTPARTVAFATVPTPQGDLLLLATREDLLAQSLALIAGRQEPSTALAAELWYTEANAALPRQDPVLHMVLNLDRLVRTPYFRSYWIQQNLTEMAQYSAAVSDLYRTPQLFREERILIPREPLEPSSNPPDLASLAALAPAEGVFRATATQDPALAVTALEEKLLGRQHAVALTSEQAPGTPETPTEAGNAGDLETRIDTPAPVSAAFSNQALSAALTAAGFDALLTWSAAQDPSDAAHLWVPIHNAVVLHGTSPFNAATLQPALQQSLRGSLTAGTLGIDFHPIPAHPEILALTGPRPLFLAVRGNLAYLTDDQPLLLALLQPSTPPALPSGATILAGFSHSAQRGPYATLTSYIDGTSQATPATPETPAYFSQNLGSLSNAFARLATQRFLQAREGSNLHQTVTYQWQP